MKTVEEVADKMYKMLEEVKGKKKLTPRDLQTAAMEFFGAEEANKKLCKEAVNVLTNSGRCTYSMYGGVSYLEIADQSGA